MNNYNPADYDSFIDSLDISDEEKNKLRDFARREVDVDVKKAVCEFKNLYAEEQKRREENSKKLKRRMAFVAFAVGCLFIIWQCAQVRAAAGF